MIIDFYRLIHDEINKTPDLSVQSPQEIALFVASEYLNRPQSLTIILPNLFQAEKVYSYLRLIFEEKVLFFPSDDQTSYQYQSSSNNFLSERLYAMYSLINKDQQILVLDIKSFLRFLPTKELFTELSFDLYVGQDYSYTELIQKIISLGYSRVKNVNGPLEYSFRGSILDIYPVTSFYPIRIEFDGDTVDSIREFKINTQESSQELSLIRIAPATDLLFQQEEQELFSSRLTRLLTQYENELEFSKYQLLEQNITEDLESLVNHSYEENKYKYYRLLKNQVATINEYQPSSRTFFFNNNQTEFILENIKDEEKRIIKQLFEQGLAFFECQLYDDFINIKLGKTRINREFSDKGHLFSSIESFCNNDQERNTFLRNLLIDKTIIISYATIDQYTLLKMFLDTFQLEHHETNLNNLKEKMINLVDFPFESGFELNHQISILTFKELYNQTTLKRIYENHFYQGSLINSIEELVIGDFVVHESYGIGKFIQIGKETIHGITKDYLTIEFAHNSLLKIPSKNFYLVRKFLGKEGFTPKLSTLGSKTWKKTKEKIEEEIDKLTNELYALYQNRFKEQGFAFSKDTNQSLIFESSFEHTLTKDQESSLREIKSDMELPYPMDRLLLGDVGFGKTEIAFRAAFKAIQDRKQVLFLAPTTLLARQHFNLAKKRFIGTDIEIRIFTRLSSTNEKNAIIDGLFENKIHFIIGTHRALSDELLFNDLGLLIVDEEQKFGVEQKEKIKFKFPNVDVLSLSATPIPRTLSLSLLSLRSISTINTPPMNRVGIQTYVVKENPYLIKEVIERELSRNGQIYYLHNRINSLEIVKRKLLKLVPSLKISVIHGQMNKQESEEIITDFYEHRSDLLLSTSIIENGIDIPNANTILIENSAFFGLSDLYQIRGRVGRGSELAYAYFMYQDENKINDISRKRLKVIQEFTKLGSGYEIAKRDLALRGAGDLLGKTQSGFMNAVGLSLYNQLLKNSILKKTDKLVKNNPSFPKVLISNFDAYIDDYITPNNEKYSLYLDIIEITTMEDLEKYQKRITDLYGTLPKEFENIFLYQEIRILSLNSAIQLINQEDNFIVITLSSEVSQKPGVARQLENYFDSHKRYLKISFINHAFKFGFLNSKNTLINTIKYLKLLISFYNSII